jgi:hypothetical protein
MRFLAGFVEKTKSPTQITEEKRIPQWSPEAEAAIRSLKKVL